MLKNSTCHAICVAESFRQDRLRENFKGKKDYIFKINPYFIYIQRENWGEAFIFLHGSVVLWGLETGHINQFLKSIKYRPL